MCSSPDPVEELVDPSCMITLCSSVAYHILRLSLGVHVYIRRSVDVRVIRPKNINLGENMCASGLGFLAHIFLLIP